MGWFTSLIWLKHFSQWAETATLGVWIIRSTSLCTRQKLVAYSLTAKRLSDQLFCRVQSPLREF